MGAAITHAAAKDRPRLPYTFEQNQGQAPAPVKFQARGEGYGLFLTDQEAVLTLSRDARTQQVVRMSLDDSRTPAKIEGVEPTGQSTNYFLGGDRSRWTTNVPHYRGVRYSQVYDGVDLVYHNSGENRLEYDFIVAPHTSPDVITLRFQGVPRMRVTKGGALELQFGDRKLVHQAPVAYQESAGRREIVAAAYELLTDHRVGFRVGKYDTSRPLVIDPVVIYSTFLGGDRTEKVNAVAVDTQGNTYVTGETTSTNFPVTGSGITKPQFAVTFGFVTKFNPSGSAIVYSAYLGGSSNTRGYAITVDQGGNAYLGGVTGARDFPLVNAVQTTQPGLNIGFVAKLNQQGNAVVFSTYLGGERNDEVRTIALDAGGNIHVAGSTTSAQFPTVRALQSQFGGSSDAFAAMYAAPNYRLAYSTFLGTAAAEEANGLAVDAAGNTYLTGLAQGPGLATAGAYQTRIISPNDAFVAKINATGDNLEWLTYYGGRSDDKGFAIALDSAGSVLVGGSTTSNNLPVTSAALQDTMRGDGDAFLAKFSATGRDLLYATYLGSSATRLSTQEVINQIAVDPLGSVTVSGLANGADFPFVRPIQSYGGGNSDGFLARLVPSLTGLEFSTPIGGSADDTALGMALDADGGIHVGGSTLSSNFPLKNAVRTTFGGAEEGFVSYICDPYLIRSSTALEFVYEPGKALPAAQTVAISACAPIPFQAQAEASFFSVAPASGVTNGSITVSVDPRNLNPGVYQGTLRLTAPDAVNSPAAITVVLKVLGPQPVITAEGIVHGATALGGPIAPGEVLVIYGKNLGPQDLATLELDAQGRVSARLKETAVYFDGVPAPLLYTSAGQISVMAPYEIAGKSTTSVEVDYRGTRSTPVSMPVAATAPGIFSLDLTGKGQGAILNQDAKVNGADNPAAPGTIISIYATGEGQTDPPGLTGAVTGGVLPKPLGPVTVTIGGIPARVEYAGSAPGMVAGVFQINVVIPAQTAGGAAEVRVKVGSATSPAGVTVAVR